MNFEQQLVRDFHTAIGDTLPLHPGCPSDTVCLLRYKLIREEYEEAANEILRGGDIAFVMGDCDLAAVAKELADLMYVVYGTALAFGIDLEPVFKAVHENNMTKVGGPRRPDGKVLKTDKYVAPDIASVLAQQ